MLQRAAKKSSKVCLGLVFLFETVRSLSYKL